MSVHAISDYFGLGLNNWQPSGVELPSEPAIRIDGEKLSEQQIISKAILHTYDIRKDDILFRNIPSDFEKQRGDYPTRREFPAYTIEVNNIPEITINKLKLLGFNTKN
ncbi:Erythronate-4-phosphate dehydrogenase [bioreactor metagenome]|uniref:Erythronate-4-phosphate dehydrogenase n=1 Tax=bioreactor metagenome TaxID=1076179 RepID=A0A645EJX1_9ZZZZ